MINMPQIPALSAEAVANVQAIFARSAFTRELGVKLAGVGVGWCATSLAITPQHLQQNDFVHAGVQATLADHTGGAAAGTLMPDGHTVLSVEFKINLLRPAVGQSLRCHATVLKPGRTLIIVESEVYATNDGNEKLVSKATITLAVVPETRMKKEAADTAAPPNTSDKESQS